jgi:hypothetical protein
MKKPSLFEILCKKISATRKNRFCLVRFKKCLYVFQLAVGRGRIREIQPKRFQNVNDDIKGRSLIWHYWICTFDDKIERVLKNVFKRNDSSQSPARRSQQHRQRIAHLERATGRLQAID